jgi:chorismate mutase
MSQSTDRRELTPLREEIRDVDRDIVELIAQRTYFGGAVAAVKAERDLPTTDTDRERVVLDRAEDNAERFEVEPNLVRAVSRLLIELSKVEQQEDTEHMSQTPEDMSLDELREEISSIDREIVELIARRTYVAETIADVKDEQGLPTTDEAQEQAVMDRAGENAERFDVDSNLVKAIFRLLIELNKVEQRESR